MSDYTYIDQRLHLLSQIIAKANRSFIPKRDDDSHTNLGFDPISNRILGRWIQTSSERLMLTYNLNLQEFQWINDHQEIKVTISSKNKFITQIEMELIRLSDSLSLENSDFSAPMHYEIPDYSFKNDPIPEFSSGQIKEWVHYRTLANTASFEFIQHVGIHEEVRIWPHHFDTGIYIVVNKQLGIGFGLAMEDGLANIPYFYMSGYGLKNELEYQNLSEPGIGRWEIGPHWKGALLPIDQIKSDQTLHQFMKDASGYFLETSRTS
ncbi:hypothetical protein KFE94_00465 [bacterium SCSIO 12643]|nr:hypothetical protein KFE94_00465 [bacterium SCSIO 12643]